MDNILYYQELVGGYHLNKGVHRCVLEVDLHKAYDSVHSDFLFSRLLPIGTLSRFLNWIRACITSSTFSASWSGALDCYFPGRHGMRQRDPLSSYLFVISMDVLSQLLNKPPSRFHFHLKCD